MLSQIIKIKSCIEIVTNASSYSHRSNIDTNCDYINLFPKYWQTDNITPITIPFKFNLKAKPAPLACLERYF